MSTTIESAPSYRERWRRWTRPPRELTMTTAGKFLCLLTLGVGFGAVNTGNNLLFLLLGMQLALILASGILSEAVVANVSARRKVPQRLVAGVGAPGGYRLDNAKKFASLSIEVGDRNAQRLAGPADRDEIGPELISWWKVWRKAPTEPQVANAYTLRLDGDGETDLEARFQIDVRGLYALETMRISTRFPFGLFEKSRRIEAPAEVLVFPAGAEAADWAAAVYGRFGEVPTNKRGRGEEFFGLRDYREGEDRRGIHWKSTARRGSAVVRETEAMTQREVEIVFHDWAPGGIGRDVFELGVSKTVGLIKALTNRGWRVGLRTRDAVLEPAVGAAHVDSMLSALAVVMPSANAPDFADSDGVARIAVGPKSVVHSAAADVALAFEPEAHDA